MPPSPKKPKTDGETKEKTPIPIHYPDLDPTRSPRTLPQAKRANTTNTTDEENDKKARDEQNIALETPIDAEDEGDQDFNKHSKPTTEDAVSEDDEDEESENDSKDK